jgi:inhibitor of KinA
MQPAALYKIFPLGDQAIIIEFGNRIDEQINRVVIARFREWSDQMIPGVKEMVPAYSTLTIYYDLAYWTRNHENNLTALDLIKTEIEKRLSRPVIIHQCEERTVRIPVCYETAFAIDIEQVADLKGITPDEVIALHSSVTYKVYMMGFLPGFAYMGEVDDKIVVLRKPQPTNIIAGSVGIAGKQTGIYPLDSPGGWQIIGRTPLKLFDTGKEMPCFLQTGDRVQFYPISKDEFKELMQS